MKATEWKEMQDKAKSAVPQTAHERANLDTVILLAEVCNQLSELNEQLRTKVKA